MPDTLFNINRTIFIKETFEEGNTISFDEEECDYSESSSEQRKRINVSMKLIFQILHYQVVHGGKNRPLHILNAM